MNLTPEDLTTFYYRLTQQDPSEVIQALFRRYPTQRGYGVGDPTERNEERFRAGVFVALAQASKDKSNRVVLFIPRAYESWADAQLLSIAGEVFRTLYRNPKVPADTTSNVKSLYKRLFAQVFPVYALYESAPAHWATYGYFEHDFSLPTWLRDGLM